MVVDVNITEKSFGPKVLMTGIKFSIDNFLKKVFNINYEEEKIISKYIYKKGDDTT